MNTELTNLNEIIENDDCPKMLQVYSDSAYQEVLCFALAYEKSENKRAYDSEKLLLTIIAGADSALQSIKASIEVGSQGLRFGTGKKGISNFEFKSEITLGAEKGKYAKTSIPLQHVRKAMAFVHEDIVNNSKYVLSFEGNPAHEIANLLGGAKYGLHILPDWEEAVFQELQANKYIVEHELYFDQNVFPSLQLFSIDLTEEQADAFISDIIKRGLIAFPMEGDGSALEKIESLADYIPNYTEDMARKLSHEITPLHDPNKDAYLSTFDEYKRQLFPVQAHSSTALVKLLNLQKCVLLQGETSSGKSTMMSAIVDGHSKMKNKTGYFSALICPPSLTAKWPLEIKALMPNAEVHVIKRTEEFIAYHQHWTNAGRPKPTHPIFFLFAFTTLRNDSANRPAIEYTRKSTAKSLSSGTPGYRNGYYCPDCGKEHLVVLSTRTEIQNDKEVEIDQTRPMKESEFGATRRLHKNTGNPPNAFCYHCNASLWTRKVKRRYNNFAEWCHHTDELMPAIKSKDTATFQQIQESQPKFASSTSQPRRVASIEYIRRKCKNMFDYLIVDEIHLLKGGNTAVGNSLGAFVAASKKVIGGTATLFGGRAEDIYYLLFRCFSADMIREGFEYHSVTPFNEQFGNIEETIFEGKEESEQSNKNSRGGLRTSRKKVVPGISPFIYGRFMVRNVVNVNLIDVWPNPVELVDTPTIFVKPTAEQKQLYDKMIRKFEREIDSREDGYKLYSQMLDYGIGYLDNPFTFPDARFKNKEGQRELIWDAEHMDEDQTLPKEKKLQEIIQNEISEGRPAIVYVRDTGSSTEGRDVRPRLKKKLEEIGAKVCILDTSTTATNNRSQWLEKKIVEEGYDVCIVSQELVKVGLDLLCTPTIIYYQFSWSLFTIQQASKRAWRIGQTEECRLFYLAYDDCYQKYMAELIAKKSKAVAAINGNSSDGLAALLGDEGDLQTMLLESVKKGIKHLEGSAEDWIAETSDRALELLENIGKPKLVERRIKQLTEANAAIQEVAIPEQSPLFDDEEVIEASNEETVSIEDAEDLINFFAVQETISNIVTVADLKKKQAEKVTESQVVKPRRAKKNVVCDDQLAFDLFAI